MPCFDGRENEPRIVRCCLCRPLQGDRPGLALELRINLRDRTSQQELQYAQMRMVPGLTDIELP